MPWQRLSAERGPTTRENYPGSSGLTCRAVAAADSPQPEAARRGLARFAVQFSPEGYQNADSSCRHRMVLVDQAAEQIPPLDLGTISTGSM